MKNISVFFILLVLVLVAGCTTKNLIMVTPPQPYGEMWNYTGHDTPFTFDIDDADTYYNLTGFTAGNLNGFSFTDEIQLNGGSFLTAEVSGIYKASFSISFISEAQGGLYGFSISHNFDQTKHRECYARRAAAMAVGNVGISCMLNIEEGDKVNIRVENENGDRDISIHTMNLNVLRVDDIK